MLKGRQLDWNYQRSAYVEGKARGERGGEGGVTSHSPPPIFLLICGCYEYIIAEVSCCKVFYMLVWRCEAVEAASAIALLTLKGRRGEERGGEGRRGGEGAITSCFSIYFLFYVVYIGIL